MENGLEVRTSMSIGSFRATATSVKCKGWMPIVYVLWILPTPCARSVTVGMIRVEWPDSKCECGVSVTEMEAVTQGCRR